MFADDIEQVDLDSLTNSTIAGVSIYSGRGEVTRVFKLTVKAGQNIVNLNGLPNVLDAESVRVEGRGQATIHDVTVGALPDPPKSSDISPALMDLYERKDCIAKALERTQKMREGIETYLSTLHVEHVRAQELD